MEYLIKIKEKKLKNICMRVNLNLKKKLKKNFFCFNVIYDQNRNVINFYF